MRSDPVIPPQTEKQFQATVVQMAKLYKWWVFHVHDSRRSEPGFPDLLMLRPPRAIAAELKTERGKVTAAQTVVLRLLDMCGIETAVWRPSMKQHILKVLR